MILPGNVRIHPTLRKQYYDKLEKAADYLFSSLDCKTNIDFLAILAGLIEVGIGNDAFPVDLVKTVINDICEAKAKEKE